MLYYYKGQALQMLHTSRSVCAIDLRQREPLTLYDSMASAAEAADVDVMVMMRWILTQATTAFGTFYLTHEVR